MFSVTVVDVVIVDVVVVVAVVVIAVIVDIVGCDHSMLLAFTEMILE